jgi:hypothetical protein
MKSVFSAILFFILCGISFNSCIKPLINDGSCDGVACTKEFRQFVITCMAINNPQSKKVPFRVTVTQKNKNTIIKEYTNNTDNVFVIMHDDDAKLFSAREVSEPFEVSIYDSNGTVVVSKSFSFLKDCCHVTTNDFDFTMYL